MNLHRNRNNVAQSATASLRYNVSLESKESMFLLLDNIEYASK